MKIYKLGFIYEIFIKPIIHNNVVKRIHTKRTGFATGGDSPSGLMNDPSTQS